MSLPALYTPEEAAAKLKVTRRAVYKWLLSGRLKGLRVGQHWRITEDELLVFMKKGIPEIKSEDTDETAKTAGAQ